VPIRNLLLVRAAGLLSAVVISQSFAVSDAAGGAVLSSIVLRLRPHVDVAAVSFSGGEPAYAIVKQNSRAYVITFSGTRLGPKSHASVHGKIVRVDPEQTSSGSALRATGTNPFTIHVDRRHHQFVFAFEELIR
jgi:hypothetical protein